MRSSLKTALATAALSGFALGGAGAWIYGTEAHAEPPREGYPPDPPGRPTADHWTFDIVVKSGDVRIASVRPQKLVRPETTPRLMGRYAIELYIGSELLDRVRFNVPGAGDGPNPDDNRPFKRPKFDRISTKFSVRIADNPRAARARLVDRATGDITNIPWPPGDAVRSTDAGLPPRDGGSSDGGASDAGDPDGGAKDAGPRDAGPKDAGFDAGPFDAARPTEGKRQ